MRNVNLKARTLLICCATLFLVTLAHSVMAASVTITATDQGNGGVKLTAAGSFAACTYCDANGQNCSTTNNGSVSIQYYCGASGAGSATCSLILDRGSLHGSHTFTATASDCTGSSSSSTTLVLDNTPSVSVTSPTGTVSGPFDITGTASFKPTLSATKGVIYAYINGGNVASKTCTSESCNFSYKEIAGSLFDMGHGGPYAVKFIASGGGASATANGTFNVNNMPTVSISSPSGTISGSFDITGTATFKPSNNTTKGTIYAYINGGNVASKACKTESCNFSYKEIAGSLFDMSHGGPYAVKFIASGGGASATANGTFNVNNMPTVSISSPSGTISGSFDITGTATFKPSNNTTKGTIYAYINNGNVASKACKTESCSFSYKEVTGNLYDMSHGGPYAVKLVASGGGASATAEGTFSVNNMPTVSVSSPSGTVSGPFDITGTATFKPSNSTTKGTIYAYINNGNVASKACKTESCSFSYKEVVGNLYDMNHGGPYAVKLVASGGGASATAEGTFSVNNMPIVSVSSPSGTVSGPFDITGTATFKPSNSTTKGTIYAYINNGNVASKACKTESCSFSYKEIVGNLYTQTPGGPYTVKLVAIGGGATANDTKTFLVVDSIRTTGPTPNNTPVGSSANLKSGDLFHNQKVLKFGNKTFEIAYNSIDTDIAPLGKGWTHNYNLTIATAAYGLKLKTSSGEIIPFTLSGGSYVPAPQSSDTSVIVKNSDNSYTRSLKNGIVQAFNSAGKLTSITDNNGNITTLAYDANNLLATVTDADGRVLTFTASGGKITAVKDPGGNSHTFVYSGNFLATINDPLGNSWAYQNDGYRLNKKTDPSGNATSYTYDSSARLTKSTDPDGKEKSIAYTNSTTSTFTEKDGSIWIQSYDPSLGLPTSKTDPSGTITSYTYDGNGNMLSSATPDGAVTSYTYDAANNMTSITALPGQTTTYTYNSLGQVLTATDVNGNITANTYDEKGNLLQTTDPNGANTVFSYDSKGNLLTKTDSNGNTTTFTYDAANNIISTTDASGATTDFTYDANGNVLTQRDPAGGITTYTYDALNRLTTITDPLGNVTRYVYDKNGNRTTVVDGTTTSSYNYLRRPLATKVAART